MEKPSWSPTIWESSIVFMFGDWAELTMLTVPTIVTFVSDPLPLKRYTYTWEHMSLPNTEEPRSIVAFTTMRAFEMEEFCSVSASM